MNKKNSLQQGFTLIELMIVIAIIGILAAIAIPAYQNYIIRAQVSEGPSLISGLETSFVENYANTGTAAATNAVLGIADPTGTYVSDAALALGQITVTYGTGANKAIQTKTVIWTPYADGGGNITWLCEDGATTVATLAANTALVKVTGGSAVASGTLRAVNVAYLPTICQ